MLIDGYENAPLVAGDDLLDLPGFWAAHLLWMCRTEEGDPDPTWFGVDEADTDAAHEALTDAQRWPVFRIPFADGHSAMVLGRNFPDDPGTEYFVTHPEWGRHGHLATADGHQAGPGLCWRELVHIARTPDQRAPGIHAEHARLLLLLPALGDQDLPDDALGTVAQALLEAGVPAGRTAKPARALLMDHPLWEPATWAPAASSPLSGGRRPFAGILHCDEPMSPRCGMPLAKGITREQSDRLARALGTWPVP
ncbi:hypothetical protein ACFYSH_32935 [Streptomyces sp. NPDC005791]|uniref:hypothetical protein n=1 Tax=unclassified Streptomyces TaxID=2593676 RepID=UPI0033CCE299